MPKKHKSHLLVVSVRSDIALNVLIQGLTSKFQGQPLGTHYPSIIHVKGMFIMGGQINACNMRPMTQRLRE